MSYEYIKKDHKIKGSKQTKKPVTQFQLRVMRDECITAQAFESFMNEDYFLVKYYSND